MWSAFVVIVFLFYIWSLDKRVKGIESDNGIGFPTDIRINDLSTSILSIKHIQKYLKKEVSIKSNKSLSKLTDRERSKYFKAVKDLIGDFHFVRLTYLPRDSSWGVYFINEKGNFVSYTTTKDHPIFSNTFGIEKNNDLIWVIRLHIQSRIVEFEKKYIPVLTAYLELNNDVFYEENEDLYIHLFDLPYVNHELMTDFGFINEEGFYEPAIDVPDYAISGFSASDTWKINNVEISFD